MSNNKRQQTMAKIQRERAVKEKRERKLEKKQLRAEERKARAAGLPLPGDELAEGDDLPAEDDVPRGEDLPAGVVLPASVRDVACVHSGALFDPHQADRDDRPVLRERVVAGLQEVLVGVLHAPIDVQRDLHRPLAVLLRALARELDESLRIGLCGRACCSSRIRLPARDAVRAPVLLNSRVLASRCGHGASLRS